MVPHQQVAVSTGTILANGTVGTTPGAGVGNYWTYSISKDGVNFTPPNWPAFSIETQKGFPLTVTYSNELYGQTYASVNLIADQTVHWAAPLGMNMMDMTPYTGPVPVVTHLHGGEVPSESDGGPDGWFTPGNGYTGPSWGNSGTDNIDYYPNSQEAATLWFHDHTLGATRLNVYAGLAGFYFLRGGASEDALHLPGWSGDGKVKEVAPAGTSGTFNPNPYLPEVEIAIQDRMFDTKGQLYFPNLPTNPMIHPFWTPEFVGDIITVNGKTWPYLSVAPRKYRFRILNGSNARTYELNLQTSGGKSPKIYQIGTDGGFLDVPVTIDPLVLAPGERVDVIIDFTASAGKTITIKNNGRTPYSNGAPPNGSTTGRIMQFVVNGTLVGADNSQIPASLRTSPLVKLTNFAGVTNVVPDKTRQLTLNEIMGMGGPLEILVNNSKYVAATTETPTEGKSEVWKIINLTADAHPIHLHLVQFQLVSRQNFQKNAYINAYNALFPGGMPVGGEGPPKPYDFYYNQVTNSGWLGGNPDVTPYLQGGVKAANLNEQGWKDTFIMYPGEVTTVVVRFAPTDKPVTATGPELLFGFDPSLGPGYVWHCHIIDHEDNEMMRPYAVAPSPYRTPPAMPGGDIAGTGSGDQLNGGYVLEQNYPNPVVNETHIRFSIPEESNVQLMILNQLGKEIQTLIDTRAPAGTHVVSLDPSNMADGIYFYRLTAGNFVATKKLIISR
jgi:FtsP/CotA-like multicopper oxidase with cupredoxin domain